MQAVADIQTTFLSNTEARKLEEQTDKRTKDDTKRAWGAAEAVASETAPAVLLRPPRRHL